MENNWIRRRVLREEDPGRQQPCWGLLFCTNLTQPTGNLDTFNTELILEILLRIKIELKKTIILVTHDKGICKFADRIIEMKNGKLQEQNIK